MRYGLLTLIALSTLAVSAAPASAQGGFQGHIPQNKLDKTRFYNAPRQMQILDERPIIKDFREAPASSPMIALPPGPQGGMGGYGGNGAGAMGDVPSGGGPGSAPVQLGGPGVQPYRTGDPMQGGQLPLPKSGFNRHSNIPAGGIKPAEGLGDGTTTNRLMGKMMKPKEAIGGSYPTGGLRGPSRSVANKAPVQAASYGSNYGAPTSSGAVGGSGGRTEGIVRGTLLNKLK